MNRSGSVASAAIDFRNDLLGRNWPNDSEVVRFSRFSGSLDAAECIARAREARILLGIWSAARRAFVYPDFQFDRRGDLRPEVAELLTLLPKENDMRAGEVLSGFIRRTQIWADRHRPKSLRATRRACSVWLLMNFTATPTPPGDEGKKRSTFAYWSLAT